MTSNWTPFTDGEDPDPRFTLANERTYLAWSRTATALLAAGIGLQVVGGTVVSPLIATVLSAVLLVSGGVLAVTSLVHWVIAERALRLGRRLPTPVMAPVLGVVLVVCATALIVEVIRMR
ncbi:YidH family protein [Gordonia sp. OPL2]|uniref:YidH family protein n=1 Tax=Gordonia sp. OPL2 TaxID=2486274 RepID=UPI001655DE6E|nr:DUF202 domain-containing protein [Gordonia sp. OPL2]RPA12462.1 DUF202 domain-containing protein [Gordonia sp. OPL2]